MKQVREIRKQHQEILQVINAVFLSLKTERIINSDFAIRLLLSALSKRLKIYLTAVDKVLYPAFMNQKEAEIRSSVREFLTETGKIKVMFEDYTQKWVKTTSISQNDIAFIMDTNETFSTLLRSISKGDEVLFSLIRNNYPQEVLS